MLKSALAAGGLVAWWREDRLLRKYLEVREHAARIGSDRLGVSYNPGLAEDLGSRSVLAFGHMMTAKLDEEVATNALAILGTALKAPGHIAAGMAIRGGASIFVSLILMVFVVVLPFLMEFGLYRLENAMTLTIVFFGLHLFYVLFGLAFWIDNHLTGALTQGGFAANPITNPMQILILV